MAIVTEDILIDFIFIKWGLVMLQHNQVKNRAPHITYLNVKWVNNIIQAIIVPIDE